MSASPAPQKAMTLPDLAREALSGSHGDVHSAVLSLTATLHGDVKLLRSVIEQVVRDAVTYRVEGAIRHRREAIIRHANSGGRASVIALANGISNALLDLPLAGGLRLRDACAEDVLDQARRYENQATDMSHKARWLSSIARLMKPDQKVGEVVSEERALQLFQEASR